MRNSVKAFEKVGYGVLQGPSDWVFEPNDREIQLEVLTGWAGAALELNTLSRARIDTWQGLDRIQLRLKDLRPSQ